MVPLLEDQTLADMSAMFRQDFIICAIFGPDFDRGGWLVGWLGPKIIMPGLPLSKIPPLAWVSAVQNIKKRYAGKISFTICHLLSLLL